MYRLLPPALRSAGPPSLTPRTCRALGAALLLAVVLAAPLSAGPILVTVFGNWGNTETTPVNSIVAFTATFVVDQDPTPSETYSDSFIVPVTVTLTNGVTVTRSAEAFWNVIGTGEDAFHEFGMNIDNLAASGDRFSAYGDLPGYIFTPFDSTANPTLLVTSQQFTAFQATYRPPEGSHVPIEAQSAWYTAALVTGSGDVPEPATASLVLFALAAGGAILRRRARV
jgi:hypothetical protein